MELRDTKINSFTEGGVYEVNFGHHSDLYGYTALTSDIMKLSEMVAIGSIPKYTQKNKKSFKVLLCVQSLVDKTHIFNFSGISTYVAQGG